MTEATPNPAPSHTPEVKQTWMPTTAGILTIIAGAGNLFAGLLVSLAGSIASCDYRILGIRYHRSPANYFGYHRYCGRYIRPPA